ncbi:MAG: hypothetical protein LKJ88_00315 [Bacilli bacterium]|jgi:hypothetical protein|nr:hypothetical protein [Bacilli bacterium]
MGKALRVERIIYIVIMILFLLSGLFNVICLPDGNGNPVWTNYYQGIFASGTLSIYGNIFLGIPLLSALLGIAMNSVEIGLNRISFPVEYTSVVAFLSFFAFGLLFASIASNMFPFGMMIIGYSLAIVVVRIIFHYGIRNQKV